MLSLLQYLEKPEASQRVKNAFFAAASEYRILASKKSCDFDEVGFTELHWAVIANQVDLVASLVEKYPKIVNQGTQYIGDLTLWNITPLLTATMHNHTEIARILLANGANPTIKALKCYQISLLSDEVFSTPRESPIAMAQRRKNSELLGIFNSFGYDTLTVQARPEPECVLF